MPDRPNSTGWFAGKLDRLQHSYRVRPGYWFAPKAYGFGAIPVTWQGWALTLAFVVAAALIANTAEHRSPVWLALLVPLILMFVGLCWAKTDGGFRWRWGRDDEA